MGNTTPKYMRSAEETKLTEFENDFFLQVMKIEEDLCDKESSL